MGLFFLLIMGLIGLGVAAGFGILIYLIVRRLNENEPYERRQN